MRLRRLALLGALALTAAAPAEPPAPDPRALVAASEVLLRSGAVRLEGALWARGAPGSQPETLAFVAWLDGSRGRGRLELTAPPREAGRTWLYLPPVLWAVEPEAGPPRRLSAAVLDADWMEGQLALGELLVGLGHPDDWRHQLLPEEQIQRGDATLQAFLVESRPRGAPQAGRGTVRQWVDVERGVLLRRDRLDAAGQLLRRVDFEDFREVAGRLVAHRWIARTAGSDGPPSVLELRAVEPRPELAAALFAAETLLGESSGTRD